MILHQLDYGKFNRTNKTLHFQGTSQIIRQSFRQLGSRVQDAFSPPSRIVNLRSSFQHHFHQLNQCVGLVLSDSDQQLDITHGVVRRHIRYYNQEKSKQCTSGNLTFEYCHEISVKLYYIFKESNRLCYAMESRRYTSHYESSGPLRDAEIQSTHMIQGANQVLRNSMITSQSDSCTLCYNELSTSANTESHSGLSLNTFSTDNEETTSLYEQRQSEHCPDCLNETMALLDCETIQDEWYLCMVRANNDNQLCTRDVLREVGNADPMKHRVVHKSTFKMCDTSRRQSPAVHHLMDVSPEATSYNVILLDHSSREEDAEDRDIMISWINKLLLFVICLLCLIWVMWICARCCGTTYITELLRPFLRYKNLRGDNGMPVF